MSFQFVYPSRGGTLPGSRGQSLADQFTPGQYLVKQKPQLQQQPATKSQPPPKQSLFSKIKSTATKDVKAVGNTASKAVIAVGKPGADLVSGKGGKLTHDTAQLASDVTGGTSSYAGANAANIAKISAAHISGNKTALANAKAASRRNLGLDNNNNITKKSLIKLGANAANAGTFLAGGAEAKTLAKTAKEGVKVLGKRVAKDATIGTTAGIAQTYAQHPEATAKEAVKSGVVGGLLGGTVPVAAKGVGAGAAKAAEIKALNSVLDKIRAPKALVENAKTQALLKASEQEKVAKATIEGQKIDQKIELIEAKKLDGKFSNVDKVKVNQLKQQKQDLGIPTAEAPNTKAPVASPKVPDKQFAHDYIANNKSQAEVTASKEAPKTEAPTSKTPDENTKLTEEVAQEYPNTKLFVRDTAEAYFNMEKDLKGGQLIDKTGINDAYGSGITRTSDHGQFYRDFFKENGRAPKLEDYETAVKQEFESGKGNIIQDSGEHHIYQLIKDRQEGGRAREVLDVPEAPKGYIDANGGRNLDKNTDVSMGKSKVAQRIANDLKQKYGELAQYQKISLKDQGERAEKLINNRELLDKVVSGEESLPAGLRATSVVTAIRHDPKLSQDVNLLMRLSKSDLASEASYSAQELRIARENAKDDPVEAIKKVTKDKVKAYEKRTGKSVTKGESEEVKQIRAAKPKVTKETWGSFVDSLKC